MKCDSMVNVFLKYTYVKYVFSKTRLLDIFRTAVAIAILKHILERHEKGQQVHKHGVFKAALEKTLPVTNVSNHSWYINIPLK